MEMRPLSLFDEVTNQLLLIRDRYSAAEDAGVITIAPEGQVAYDKLVQFMDVARGAGFTDVGIAKLRG
jgi:biopolymer transport protein ExbD